jgi:hypothetical protein
LNAGSIVRINAAILGASSAESDHVNNQRNRDNMDNVSIESIFGDNFEVVEPTVPHDNDNDWQVKEAATACVDLHVEEWATPHQINAANQVRPPS